MNLSLIHAHSTDTVPVPASVIESQTLETSSRASTLDSDLCSKVPSHASETNRIGGLASW